MGQVRVYNDLAMIRMIVNTIYYSSCSAVQGSTLVEVMVIVGWQLLFIIIISKNSNLGGPSRSSIFSMNEFLRTIRKFANYLKVKMTQGHQNYL